MTIINGPDNGPEPLYDLGDTLVITGISFEEERPGEVFNYYSYYEAGTTEVGELYLSNSTNSSFRTDQEWSYVYSSEENDQGIVDLVVSSSTEYTYNASNDRLISQGSSTTSDRLDGTSETIDFGIDYSYASSEGYELESSTGLQITYETLEDGSVNQALEISYSDYSYVETASDINDWYQRRTAG